MTNNVQIKFCDSVMLTLLLAGQNLSQRAIGLRSAGDANRSEKECFMY